MTPNSHASGPACRTLTGFSEAARQTPRDHYLDGRLKRINWRDSWTAGHYLGGDGLKHGDAVPRG